jgi:hypothetical protein
MKNAFIIMPFTEVSDEVYNFLFKPPLLELGYEIRRADNFFDTMKVMTEIYTAIKQSTIILCDVSGRHPNVFYELGLAHAIGKPTIVVTDDIKTVPFDLRGFNVLVYNISSEISVSDFKISLKEVIKKTEKSKDIWPPPLISEGHEETEKGLSFFISYSMEDKEFVTMLHRDLQDAGINCWLDSKDLVVGEKWQKKLKETIAQQKQFLLILSENSIKSDWVRYELKKAQEIQEQKGEIRLFPIRIDDAIFTTSELAFSSIASQIQIADFEEWRDKKEYVKSFQKLIRDITVANASVYSKETV